MTMATALILASYFSLLMEHTESQRNSNAKLTLILDTIVPKLTSTITDLIVIPEKFGNSLIIVSILQ